MNTTGLFPVEIFSAFSLDLRLKNYSENTITGTCYNVKRFLKIMNISPRQVGSTDIHEYLEYMVCSDRYSEQSIRTNFQSLKRFYGWLHRTGRIFCDPTADFETPEPIKRLPKTILSFREMELIRNAVSGKSLLNLRDKAIVEVLYSTGLRLSELSGLNIADLDLNDGILFVQKGKGFKSRQAILNQDAVSAIKNYLKCRISNGIPSTRIEHQALWINYRGDRLSGQMIRKILNGYAKAAGVTTPAHPHAWRHGLATALLRQGASIVEVQRFLGHVSTRTTQIYTQILISDLKAAHRMCHPRELDFERKKRGTKEWMIGFRN